MAEKKNQAWGVLMIAAQQMAKWLLGPVENILLQIPRALAASLLAAVLDFGVLTILVEVAGWWPPAAAVVGYLVGGLLQYVLCLLWVFPGSPGNKTVGFLTFTLLSLGGLGITWLVMAGGEWIHLPYTFSKVAALGLAFFWNFLSRKYLLFQPQAGPSGRPGTEPKLGTQVGTAALVMTGPS